MKKRFLVLAIFFTILCFIKSPAFATNPVVSESTTLEDAELIQNFFCVY